MLKKGKQLITVFAAITLLSGCAAYRTDSNRSFASTNIEKNTTQKIIISEDSLPGKRYAVLGPIKAEVKKLTAFHKDPTKEQVNVVLSDKAMQLGADGVVNTSYKSGIGMTTWGYIEAQGTAVKFNQSH